MDFSSVTAAAEGLAMVGGAILSIAALVYACIVVAAGAQMVLRFIRG